MSGRAARQQTLFGKARSAIQLSTGKRAPAFDPEDVEIRLFVRGDTTKVTTPRKAKSDIKITTKRGEKLDRSPVLRSLDYGVSVDGSNGAFTATMSLQRPDAGDPLSLGVDLGDQVGLDVVYKGKTYTGFRMRAATPQISLPDGNVDFELVDPFAPITKIKDHWTYRKSSNRPSGWTCDQIVRHACGLHGVPVGTLMPGRYHLKPYKAYESLLELVIAVYEKEQEKTGRQATFRIQGDRLEVVARSRNRVAYVLDGAALKTANVSVQGFTEAPTPATPVTVIDARGHTGKNKTRTDLRSVVFDQRALNQYGYVRRRVDYGKVDSFTDLRDRGKRTLAKHLRLVRTAEIEAVFLPFVQVGDAVVVAADLDQDFGGEDRVAFVTSYQHALSPDSRQTSLSLKEQDDFLNYRLNLEKRQREAARKKRAKK